MCFAYKEHLLLNSYIDSPLIEGDDRANVHVHFFSNTLINSLCTNKSLVSLFICIIEKDIFLQSLLEYLQPPGDLGKPKKMGEVLS